MRSLLEIARREIDGITIFSLKGRLVAGEASNSLRETVRQELGTERSRVVLNLGGVDFIDSTGLGALVICFTSARKSGGALKLAQLNKHNIQLLVLTKLSTIFEIFQDEQDAVNSFFPERRTGQFDLLEFVKQSEEQPET